MKRKRLKSYLFWSHEDITRRWPFASQEEGSYKEPNLLAPWFWTSRSRTVVFCIQSMLFLLSQLDWLKQSPSGVSSCNFCYNISSTLVQYLICFPYLFYVLSTQNNYFDGNPSDRFHYSRNFHLFFNPQKNHTMLFPFYCPKTCSS